MFSVATADFRNKRTIAMNQGGSYYDYFQVTAANALQNCSSGTGIGGPYACVNIHASCVPYFFGCGPSPYYGLTNEGVFYRQQSFYSYGSTGAAMGFYPWQ